MNTAIITTTIHEPVVLQLMTALDDSVAIYVAGDLKTPHDKVLALLEGKANAHYLSPEEQESMGTRVSDLIGWKSIQRRNLALFKAIEDEHEIIVTFDDDNYPVDERYFSDFRDALQKPFQGLMASHTSGWFDVGVFTDPIVRHRGFPLSQATNLKDVTMNPVTNVKLGVRAGLWLGDPDIDAASRIVNGPLVVQFSDVARAGFSINPNCYAPFNSQNTAYVKEIAPLMMVLPAVGRYDDVWASYIAQRIMRDRNYCVSFGRPFVWQDRNQQDLLTNLEAEIFGMRHNDRFVDDLNNCDIGGGSVIEQLRRLYQMLARKDYMPDQTVDVGLAWCADCEDVLGKQ